MRRVRGTPMRNYLTSLALGLLLAPGAALGGLPPEDRCPAIGVSPTGLASDAVLTRLREGHRISYDMMLALRDLLPQEIWQNRRVFFYPGMQMLIGGCHRRYPVPSFYQEATRRFSEGVSDGGFGSFGSVVVIADPFLNQSACLEHSKCIIKCFSRKMF